MSTLKVNKLRDTAGSADAITLDPNGGAVLAGVTTVTSVKVGAAVTISESGLEATGVGITVANINGEQISGRRNLIINGAMKVAQRGTSNSGLDGYGSMDRFYPDKNQLDNLQGTQEQVGITDLPGFTNAFKLDITTAETALAADEYFTIGHRIEAQDLQQLAYGTSSAKSMTLSFHVKSSTTGTYVVSCYQADGGKLITATYTINSANTWEKKVITYPGNTGTAIDDNTDQGLQFNFGLAAGSDWTSSDSTSWGSYSDAGYLYGQTANLIAQTGTFFLTGVQLEVGSTATAFEHRSFAEELALCQRYYFRFTASTSGTNVGMGWQMTSSAAKIVLPFPTSMRTRPTAVETTGTATDYSVSRTSTYEVCDSVPTFAGASKEVGNVNTNQVQASLSTGIAVALRANSTSFYLGFSAEI